MSRFDFNFGAHVQCLDGQNGKLEGVVVNPTTLQVTSLIVKRGFLIGKQAWVLPLALVKSATMETIQLAITSDEFNHYPQYRLIEFEEPAPSLNQRAGGTAGGVFYPHGLYGSTEPIIPLIKKKIREGIAADQKVIEPKTPLKNAEGTVGAIIQVRVDRYSQTITHLTVQQGLFFSTEQLSVPVSVVENIIDDDAVITAYTGEELAKLTHKMQQTSVSK